MVKNAVSVVATLSLKIVSATGIKDNSGVNLLLTSNHKSEHPQVLFCEPWVLSAVSCTEI